MSKPHAPNRQVCPLCAIDDFVELSTDAPDIWSFVCTGPHHPKPYDWSPVTNSAVTTGRTGLGEELGIYEDLLACVHPAECVEYGVVEWRFAQLAPTGYETLIAKFGHRAIGETKYSTSTFLAHALGQLEREGLLAKSWVPGSAYWDYLTQVSAWAQPGSTAGPTSWKTWASQQGLDPDKSGASPR